VLFRPRFYPGLRQGSITITFRRWEKPAAKAGGRQRVAGVELAIDAVTPVDEAAISVADARAAGFDSPESLLAELAKAPSGRVYRIEFHVAGPDTRTALRARDDLAPEEIAALRRRLERLDHASPRGPWTAATLALIAGRPAIRAADLAASLGRDTPSFKLDVRKLKELGLTESLEVGYRISPRGRALLSAMNS
jgi:hypothetical protein